MSARERLLGEGRAQADTQVRPLHEKGKRSGANGNWCETTPFPTERGGARPLQWGPEPDGRGGALPTPGFSGSMEAAKDSVGADLCVGP